MPEFLTERQLTQNSPKWICRALKKYRGEGGDETLFLRGVYFVQILAMLAPADFLRVTDYQTEITESYQAGEWSFWHLRLLEEFHYFISNDQWVFFKRKYQRIHRQLGLKLLQLKAWLVNKWGAFVKRAQNFFGGENNKTATDFYDSG